jgi:hydroxymethylglutaryl-CoA reductase
MRSDLSGFHKLSSEERLQKIKELANLDDNEVNLLKKTGSLDISAAENMIENVIGTFELPYGIATNFTINGKDYLIPMVLEEPSVVAGASNAAKLARPSGFQAESTDPVMIGQIQVVRIPDINQAIRELKENKPNILQKANERDSVLLKFGGGAKDLEIHQLETDVGEMLNLHLLVDVRDAMGANAVNSMCEAVAPFVEELTEGQVRLRIISNLATFRMAKAKAIWTKQVLEASSKGSMNGEEVVKSILESYHFAVASKHRCSTHNKGIMNGIDAVVIATGNDFRAVEAGAHSFAALEGYKPLTKYYRNENGDLVGEIELPLAVGTVGGSTKTNPIARISLKILGVKTSQELAEILASVGLAQSFAAMKALSTEGIQRGHMRLHARNIAMSAGATGEAVDRITLKMIEEGNISFSRAKEMISDV